MQSGVRCLLCASLGFHGLEVLGATLDPDFFSVGRDALLSGYNATVPPFGWLDGPRNMSLQFGVNLRKIVAVDMITGSIELFFLAAQMVRSPLAVQRSGVVR